MKMTAMRTTTEKRMPRATLYIDLTTAIVNCKVSDNFSVGQKGKAEKNIGRKLTLDM